MSEKNWQTDASVDGADCIFLAPRGYLSHMLDALRRHFSVGDPGNLELNDHVFWYGYGSAELDRLAVAAFTVGVERNERMMFITDAPDISRLRDLEGIDELVAAGHLELAEVEEVYRATEAFSAAEQLTRFERRLHDALEHGYAGIRVVADNTSLARGPAARFASWLEWELLSDRFQSRNPVLGLCYVDRDQVGVRRIGDLAAVHPVLQIGADVPTFQLYVDADVIHVVGAIDVSCAAQLHRILASARPGEGIILDVSKVEFIDHQALLAVNDAARTRGGIRIEGARPIVRRVWELLDPPIRRLEFA